jgi:CheY-like chemotaxis protein
MRKLKVVLVDNDPDEIEFMQEGFNSSGFFEVAGVAANGDELLENILKPGQPLPDIIVSDLNMPGKNGLDILQVVRASAVWAHIKVVIVSTSSAQSFVSQCMKAGADLYLTKPPTFLEYEAFARELHLRIGPPLP